jgi:hypothetical protein
MNILGRIFLVLVVFSVVASVLVAVVNASTGSATASEAFAGDRPRPGGMPDGREFRPSDGMDAGWISGLIRNIGVIAVITTLIVFPKSLLRAKRKSVSADSD